MPRKFLPLKYIFSLVEGSEDRVANDKPDTKLKDDDKPEEDKEEEGASGISGK